MPGSVSGLSLVVGFESLLSYKRNEAVSGHFPDTASFYLLCAVVVLDRVFRNWASLARPVGCDNINPLLDGRDRCDGAYRYGDVIQLCNG